MLYSIILTVFNEERTIARLVDELESKLRRDKEQTEILIVDDGSSDNSLVVSYGLRKRYRNIKIVSNPVNNGRGFALKKGIGLAKGDVIGIIDTDLQYLPADLVTLLHAVRKERADLICGWRRSNKNSMVRRILSRGFNLLCRLLFAVNVHDSNAGIKAGKRELFEKIPLRGGAYRLIAVRAAKKYTISELPVGHMVRQYGNSRIPTPKIFIETLAEVAKAFAGT